MKKKFYSLILASTLLAGTLLSTSLAHEKVVVIPLGKTSVPVSNSTGNAKAGDVLQDRTFSNGSGVGVIGTMPHFGSYGITPGNSAQNIPAGYHDGTGEVPGAPDLVPDNIAAGATIFGIAGDALFSTGNATADNVLSGTTFSNNSVSGISGTMTNRGSLTITPGTADQIIPSGYHDGSGTVTGDPNLTGTNITVGTNIFGVTGNALSASGNATAEKVLSGVTFSNSSASGINGTMTNRGSQTITPGTTEQTIFSGYHDGTGTVTGDPNLVPEKIASGNTIFGVAGNARITQLAQTGQITSHSSFGDDDGSLKKGIAFPEPRFTANGNGTVTDNLTGLVWLQNANCYGQRRSWNTALQVIRGIEDNDCGLTDGSEEGDWRLPNRREMSSLLNFEYSFPCLSNDTGTEQYGTGTGTSSFQNVQNNAYWTSTTAPRGNSSNQAWLVVLGRGDIRYQSKNGPCHIWPVRDSR